MRLQPIPNDQEFAADRRLQRLAQLDDLGVRDRARKEGEEETPEADAGDHRELLPAEVILQHRRLTPRAQVRARQRCSDGRDSWMKTIIRPCRAPIFFAPITAFLSWSG